jgi:hypothetical protein
MAEAEDIQITHEIGDYKALHKVLKDNEILETGDDIIVIQKNFSIIVEGQFGIQFTAKKDDEYTKEDISDFIGEAANITSPEVFLLRSATPGGNGGSPAPFANRTGSTGSPGPLVIEPIDVLVGKDFTYALALEFGIKVPGAGSGGGRRKSSRRRR